MVLCGGISNILVSFPVLSTLLREKVFSDTFPAQVIFPVNNNAIFFSILCLIKLFLYCLSNPEPCQYAMFPVVLELIVHMHYHLSQA